MMHVRHARTKNACAPGPHQHTTVDDPPVIQATLRRHSTVAWKSHQPKTRLALCLTTLLPVIINAKASSLGNIFPEGAEFDTDSFPITIDSGSTYCLLSKCADFEGTLTKINVRIQGISETKGSAKWKGTVQWRVLDDDGTEHTFKIPNTLLVEESFLFWILSPQHLSQENSKSKIDTMKSRTRAIVGNDEVELQWANCWFKKTIKICKNNNILIMQSASGFRKYQSFASNIELEESGITCFDTHLTMSHWPWLKIPTTTPLKKGKRT
jgi:hypothetical protein